MTVFEKILNKEIPAKIVYEDDDILAFHDISPQAPVHVLVIPKAKIVAFNDLADQGNEMVGKLFRGAAVVAKKLGIDEKGYRVVINCGEHGQQTVAYLHLHLLAGRQLKWPPG